MSLHKYITRIQRLDNLIRLKSTGPPKELASKLGISERWLYVLLYELRQELGCPIQYSAARQSYIYTQRGKITIGFRTELTAGETKNIRGGGTPGKYSTVFINAVRFR